VGGAAGAVVGTCTGSTTIVRDGCDRLMRQAYALRRAGRARIA
jgi:hypothetical protein